jgi:hypothetical protein
MVMKEFTAGERLFAADLNDNFDETQTAENITSGTLNAARISGSYTGITGTGTLNAGSVSRPASGTSTSERLPLRATGLD